jgi:hypothetical protein
MNSESNGHADFKVVPVGTVKADLRRFHKELMQYGKGAAFLAVLRKVNDRLCKDPRGFGETLYRLPALKLLVHQGIISPLVVTYGVHDELPIVFVHVVKLLSNPEK